MPSFLRPLASPPLNTTTATNMSTRRSKPAPSKSMRLALRLLCTRTTANSFPSRKSWRASRMAASSGLMVPLNPRAPPRRLSTRSLHLPRAPPGRALASAPALTPRQPPALQAVGLRRPLHPRLRSMLLHLPAAPQHPHLARPLLLPQTAILVSTHLSLMAKSTVVISRPSTAPWLSTISVLVAGLGSSIPRKPFLKVSLIS